MAAKTASTEETPQEFPEPFPHTVAAIYELYESRKKPWQGWNLSIGSFGDECDRAIWYGWRWAYEPRQRPGRIARLLETGNREETRMVQDLRDVGIEILDRDPSTGRQWAVSAFGGHLQGRLDGIARGFREAPAMPHVCEFKTHSEKNFNAIKKKGLKVAKPGHYWQVIGYLHLTGYTRGFYLAHNKNSDELFVERLEADPIAGAALMNRAERILTAAQPLARLHEDPTAKAAFACKFCDAFEICHSGQFARVNCRTCLHSSPNLETGAWHCARHDREISIDEQKVGCSSHLFLPDLVPGEQVDVDEAAELVTYQLFNGETWVDGAKDVAAVRYWYHPESSSLFTTKDGEHPGDDRDPLLEEVTREQFDAIRAAAEKANGVVDVHDGAGVLEAEVGANA